MAVLHCNVQLCFLTRVQDFTLAGPVQPISDGYIILILLYQKTGVRQAMTRACLEETGTGY